MHFRHLFKGQGTDVTERWKETLKGDTDCANPEMKDRPECVNAPKVVTKPVARKSRTEPAEKSAEEKPVDEEQEADALEETENEEMELEDVEEMTDTDAAPVIY